MDHQALLQAERERRSAMWEAVQRIQQERPMVAGEVQEIGCYKGARGIWRDKKSTSDLTPSGHGICVGISSRGKYEDEIDEDIGIYDYPLTEKPGHDEGDIDSMRSALELGLPVFLIRDTNAKGELVQGKGPKRRVDRIEFLEDDPISGNLVFTFSLGGRRDYQLPADEEGSCFQARETTKKEVSTKKRSQAAFRAAVVRRYGGKRCTLCDAPSEVIEAAHIVPVSENGSDDSGNGLLLCRNHHALFDMGKWCLEPSSLEVIPTDGHDLKSLGLTRPNASHLQVPPNQEALDWRWGEFQHQQPKPVA